MNNSGAPWVRKFGHPCIQEILVVRWLCTHLFTPQANQCEMIFFTLCGACNLCYFYLLIDCIHAMHGHLGHLDLERQKTTTKPSLFFFRLNFNVYADVYNRERAGSRDKKQRRWIFIRNKTWDFYMLVRKSEMLVASKVKMSGSEKESKQEHWSFNYVCEIHTTVQHLLHKTCN